MTTDTMKDPAHVLYASLQKKQKIQVWVAESKKKIEGQFIGMDEFMNLVLDSPEEIEKNGERHKLGKNLLLRGDAIALIDCS
eukprot:CAMPEP_0201511156 /NCGR_PEP_ID=MMETSP0161_2-20130828/3651_1 /ASSEMBLY_ACC=CAM_ASM_000251 /TAXON_ID=180227 /ORGANISM="Neoparamoeba aestuarina, Strain SoJaBio B1-5/56/2" /LENGTH=81 /DNA_ID=CAMNT_0047906525 /DNA_START=31 /DNA_END=273 /DNA_ORIENTATION=-